MKKFNGCVKDVYVTMFGVIEIKHIRLKYYKYATYQINFITYSSRKTKIIHNNLRMVTKRVFPNKTKALHFIIEAERELLKDLEKIKSDCF